MTSFVNEKYFQISYKPYISQIKNSETARKEASLAPPGFQMPETTTDTQKVANLAPSVAKKTINTTSNSPMIQKMQIKKISMAEPPAQIPQKNQISPQNESRITKNDQHTIQEQKSIRGDHESIHERKPSSTSGADSGFESTKNYDPSNRQLKPAPPR